MRHLIIPLSIALAVAAGPARADERDDAIKQLQQQVAALIKKTDQQAAQIAQLRKALHRPRPSLHSKSNKEWSFRLTEDKTWKTVGTLQIPIEVKTKSVLILSANGHVNCEPARGKRMPDPGKWLSLSFFVDDKNSQMIQGFPLFHAPKLSWGQYHTHPNPNWVSGCLTQMCVVEPGKHTITLRAMQDRQGGIWHLNGMGMHVLVLPR